MGNEKLISELSDYMKGNNLKNKEVEGKIGLPKNSLSNFLSLKKELPKKYNEPILKYISQSNVVINTLGDLKDKVTTADKIPVPESKIDIGLTWVDKVADYCGANGLNPEDLIEFHAKMSKREIKPKNASNAPIIKQSKFTSDWRKKFIESKTGYKI